MRTITTAQLKEKIGTRRKFALVNVLPEMYFKAKHIPGSINMPVDDIEKEAGKKLPDKSMEIVVYCASSTCHASPTAAMKLKALGYSNVIEFEGGLKGWEDSGYAFGGTDFKEVKKMGDDCCC